LFVWNITYVYIYTKLVMRPSYQPHMNFRCYDDIYGIQNLCDGRKSCSFDVTNSNIGSSCGADGKASLQVSYKCKRKLYFIQTIIHLIKQLILIFITNKLQCYLVMELAVGNIKTAWFTTVAQILDAINIIMTTRAVVIKNRGQLYGFVIFTWTIQHGSISFYILHCKWIWKYKRKTII
jgi:hypothetical protein